MLTPLCAVKRGAGMYRIAYTNADILKNSNKN